MKHIVHGDPGSGDRKGKLIKKKKGINLLIRAANHNGAYDEFNQIK